MKKPFVPTERFLFYGLCLLVKLPHIVYMDTLTHMALGACIGQAIGYRKFGSKALLFGAVAAGLPDIDVMWASSIGEYGGWLYHRHVTHALWFAPVIGALMGFGLWKHYANEFGREGKDLWAWITVMVIACLSHPILDFCTIYGTQLLAPFSNQRFEISSVSIIDPIYTFILVFGLLVVAFSGLRKYARAAAVTAIILTTSYLVYGVYLNNKAEHFAEKQLEEQNIKATKVEAFTTIFQPYVRRVVVRELDGVRVGFVSTFAPSTIYWSCQKDIDDKVKQAIMATPDAQIFDWFSIGHLGFAKSRINNEYVVTDIRYGVPGDSVFGWWGQVYRVTQDADGKYNAVYVTKMQVDRGASIDAIGNLFKAAYGYDNNFLPTADVGCKK